MAESRAVTAQQRLTLLETVGAGADRETAARHAGIAPGDLDLLLDQDEDLGASVAAVEARADIANVATVTKAAHSGDWRAASYLLERRARAFDPAKHCGGRSKTTGLRCANPKGFRTEHAGGGNCWLHGGRTPNGIRHGQIEIASNALASLGIPSDVDPLESLAEAMRVAAWREIGLRHMVQERPALFGVDHLGDERPDVIAEMHREALDQRAKIAKLCIDAGLDKRMVEIAERTADVLGEALDAALRAAGVTDDEAMRRANSALVHVLGRAPVGVELN